MPNAYYPIYVDGKFLETKSSKTVINPSNSEVVAEVALAGKEEIEYALEAAKNAYQRGQWRRLSLKKRKELLLKISQGIMENAQELARLETVNTGKPIKETTFMDIPSSAKTFEFFANNLECFLQDEEITVTENVKSRLIREPWGLSLLIVPWNYPLLIASWKMAQALAAGNTVILKPSSLTPLSVLELAKIISKIEIPAGVVNILNFAGGKEGELICSDRRVDMISFTGSNATGRKIMEYATCGVKKMIMELGGKSAAIVLPDADLELAVNGSLCSIFLNQGQMCTAMSRILVHQDIYDSFVTDFVAKAKRIKLGAGLDYQSQMGPLISEEHRRRVWDFVERAKKEGAEILCGGKPPQEEGLKKGFFFEPTVITGVSPDMEIFKEEVFGPVVCVMRFSEKDEAVELANRTEFGLAQCIWSKNLQAAQELASQINAGIIWTNTYGMFYNELPYGGFKQSGFGKELGKEGFQEYCRLKNIIIDSTSNSKPLVNYWYGL